MTHYNRLAPALRSLGLERMAAEAEHGTFSDFATELAAPKMTLVQNLELAAAVGACDRAGAEDLIRRVLAGEFDG